jgi:DNA-binding LacI/PurR family transcriptional regulator
VAKAANVSPATVSLVLHQKGQLAPVTRERVLDAVKLVGYQRRQFEESARRKRPTAYCLIVDDIGNPYFHEIYKGISDNLDLSEAIISIASTDDSLERQAQVLDNFIHSPIDGLVVVPASGTNIHHLDALRESGIPFLMAVRKIGFGSFNYVGGNPMQGMLLATEHLLRLGHRRVAFVGGNVANYAFNERYAGFVSTMRKYSLPVEERLILSGGSSKAFGRKAAAEILRADDPPTAFIGYNDLVAIGIMNAVNEAGLVPGRDIAVVGYDDIPEASEQPIPLTTVATPPYELGKVIANALARMKDDPGHGPIDITYPPNLIQRESSGTPAECIGQERARAQDDNLEV